MDTPQEVEVWYVLPAIRRQIAINLKKEGLKQKEIALLLNLTEPAVSQYLKKKRGEEISFSKEVCEEISKSTKIIASDKTRYRNEIQRLLKIIKESKFICSVCNDHTSTKKNCKICY